MNIVDQQTFRDAMSCMGAAVNSIISCLLYTFDAAEE